MLKKILLGTLIFTSSTLFAMSVGALNKASKTELMEINGIGEAKAEAIIKERKKGKFKSIEDVSRVKGVGDSLTKNIKHDVKVKKTSTKKSSTKKHTTKKNTDKKDTTKKKSSKKKSTKKDTKKKETKK
jgi:competence protein ComEA